MLARKLQLIVIFVAAFVASSVFAEEIMLKNGMILRGRMAWMGQIADNPFVSQKNAGETQTKLIVMLDDGLRRTYVPFYQVIPDSVQSTDAIVQKIRIPQRVAKGKSVASIQSILQVTPFDDLGHRTFSTLTNRGRLDIVQGITEITPLYTKLEALIGHNAIQWDSRIATSSIPRETLSRILRNRPDANTANGRLEVVRLLFAAERYADARDEFEQARQQFPELAEVERLYKQLKQLSATKLIDEIELRREAGQHRRVLALLNSIPDKGIAGATLERVREILTEYDEVQDKGHAILDSLKSLSAKVSDARTNEELDAINAEISNELSISNIDRFDDFIRLAADASTDSQRLALAISGWIVGTGATTDNLTVALSLVRARDLVVKYLRSSSSVDRQDILQRLGNEEGGTVNQVARIVANMKPPIVTSPELERSPGHYRIRVEHPTSPIAYDVQLPDEYDPYRRYPVVVTLHGTGRTPAQQIDWWCGQYNEGYKKRMGVAMRHGYIVIAPHWARRTQRKYEYLATEHLAVLASLRDAFRRFAIDTDRVFLSGLSMGADAAWDIALAHPDIWAGVIPIVATSHYGGKKDPRYISQYVENAKYVPQYFVCGSIDGDRLSLNSTDFDNYLTHVGYDTMIVEYIGRGHDHFYDEIQRIFTWMNLPLHRRNSNLTEFEVVNRRPWDNFFWCVELDDFPEVKMIHPLEWPKRKASHAPITSVKKLPNNSNTLQVRSAAAKVTLLLSPEWLDFDRPAKIRINSKTEKTLELVGSTSDLLEDVRRRGDRLRPFWLRMEVETGRRR